MAERGILHQSKLRNLSIWLTDDGWKLEQPKGQYEVLRATKEKRTFLVYAKADAKEHYTIPDNCISVFMAYLKGGKRVFKCLYDECSTVGKGSLCCYSTQNNPEDCPYCVEDLAGSDT